MLRLLLLRHAKAERLRPGERDHDRRLTERGRGDAQRIGAYVARHGLLPDQVIVSPAARTRETWSLTAGAMGGQPNTVFEQRVYEASPAALLQVIKQTDPQVRTLLMIGHNPTLQELAVQLVATGDVDTRQRLQEDFPTSGLAVIDFALDSWSKVHPQGGRLEHFIDPGTIAGEDR
jgi:phosphohistidine phosphatase